MTVKKLIILLISGLFINNLSAQSTPKYSNEFLNIGVGARALGMSGAVCASSDDITSIYWNPASLTSLDNELEFGLMHAEYFAGVAKYDFVGIAYKIDNNNVIGGGLIRFGVDDIPNTLELIDNDGNIRYDLLSSFSSSDIAILLSYARKTKIENLSIGGNIKIIRRKAGDFGGSWGFGFDISSRYKTDKWIFAATAKDVTSTFNAWTFNTDLLSETWLQTGNVLPENSMEITLPILNLGFARTFNIYQKFSGLAELDMFSSFDGKRNTIIKSDFISIDPRAGIELNYDKKVFLRAGIGNFQEIPLEDNNTTYSIQTNIGAGITFRGLSINYALSNLGSNENFYSHVFSLRYRFNTNQNTLSQSSFDE